MTQLTVSIDNVSMDRAIDDIKHGRVYEASSVEDLIKQCKSYWLNP
jgi:hypothetical protein